MALNLREFSLARMERAVEKVHARLLLAARTLGDAGIDYAVAGGNAVAAWVARIDEAAVRNTRDVDILLRRSDLPAAIAAMEAAGFVYRHVAGLDIFQDRRDSSVRDAVHIVFAGENVGAHVLLPTPDVAESADAEGFRVLGLEALVRSKLPSYRDKDKTHLRDLLDVGLIDATWVQKYPEELGARLQHLIDTPEG